MFVTGVTPNRFIAEIQIQYPTFGSYVDAPQKNNRHIGNSKEKYFVNFEKDFENIIAYGRNFLLLHFNVLPFME